MLVAPQIHLCVVNAAQPDEITQFCSSGEADPLELPSVSYQVKHFVFVRWISNALFGVHGLGVHARSTPFGVRLRWYRRNHGPDRLSGVSQV